jgi:hypothetical protein
MIPTEDSQPSWGRTWENTKGDAIMPVSAAALN